MFGMREEIKSTQRTPILYRGNTQSSVQIDVLIYCCTAIWPSRRSSLQHLVFSSSLPITNRSHSSFACDMTGSACEIRWDLIGGIYRRSLLPLDDPHCWCCPHQGVWDATHVLRGKPGWGRAARQVDSWCVVRVSSSPRVTSPSETRCFLSQG